MSKRETFREIQRNGKFNKVQDLGLAQTRELEATRSDGSVGIGRAREQIAKRGDTKSTAWKQSRRERIGELISRISATLQMDADRQPIHLQWRTGDRAFVTMYGVIIAMRFAPR